MLQDDGASGSSGDVAMRLEAIRRATPEGVDFWRAFELMQVLGYDAWHNFENTIHRAIAAFDASGESSSHHFYETVRVGGTSGPKGKDYFLSRAACYVTVMNGDPRKPEIAEAQKYFAVQTRRMEKLERFLEDRRRVELRTRVTENTKKLGTAAKDAGVQRYAIFHAAGIKAMYAMRLDEIKAARKISHKENWLDRMGAEELAANDFRLTQAESKLRRESIRGEQKAIDAHATVGREVRNLISKLGNTLPEHLPVERPISEIEKRLIKKGQAPIA